MRDVGGLFKGLVEHLRKASDRIVSRREFRVIEFDPTYGDRETSVTISEVDFEALLTEIDKFGDELREQQCPKENL